jgi:hypothetical protein
MNKLNGDSLVAKLTTKFGSLGGGADAKAIAAATDQEVVLDYLANFGCRMRVAREMATGQHVDDQLDDLEAEISNAFGALDIVMAEGGTTAIQRRAHDSSRVKHVDRLRSTYDQVPRLTAIDRAWIDAALPYVNLMSSTAVFAGVELNLPEIVKRAVGNASLNAARGTFAAQQVTGNTRMTGEILRALLVDYGRGSYRLRSTIQPAIASVYQIGRQLLNQDAVNATSASGN